MRINRPISRSRRRSPIDATSVPDTDHVVEQPTAAHSLRLLRQPRVSAGQRQRATLALQQAVGNAQVQRELAQQAAVVQRDDEKPVGDPAQVEQQQRDKQAADAAKPAGERVVSASRELVMHYAAENLKSLGDEALRQLVRAWRETPGGVIAAGTIIGAAGVAYLVGTNGSLPEITIPLDFLAEKVPALRGAELKFELSGPVTKPEGIQLGITFHEGSPKKEGSGKPGSGTAFTPRMTLRQGDAVADGPEVGDQIMISGRIPVPHGAKAADVAATIAAINDGSLDVEIGGQPAMQASILSVTDSFKPDKYGLSAPPLDRHLLVRVRSAVPPMFHQRAEIFDQRPVYVRVNRVSSEGEATIRVHMRPFPK